MSPQESYKNIPMRTGQLFLQVHIRKRFPESGLILCSRSWLVLVACGGQTFVIGCTAAIAGLSDLKNASSASRYCHFISMCEDLTQSPDPFLNGIVPCQ